MHAWSPQSCLTLCDPLDYNPAAFSVHEILQARIPEWVAISSSRGSSRLRDWTCVFCSSCIAGRFFIPEPPGNSWYLSSFSKQFLLYSLLSHLLHVPWNVGGSLAAQSSSLCTHSPSQHPLAPSPNSTPISHNSYVIVFSLDLSLHFWFCISRFSLTFPEGSQDLTELLLPEYSPSLPIFSTSTQLFKLFPTSCLIPQQVLLALCSVSFLGLPLSPPLLFSL